MLKTLRNYTIALGIPLLVLLTYFILIRGDFYKGWIEGNRSQAVYSTLEEVDDLALLNCASSAYYPHLLLNNYSSSNNANPSHII